MTVRELIELLSVYNGDLKVAIVAGRTIDTEDFQVTTGEDEDGSECVVLEVD